MKAGEKLGQWMAQNGITQTALAEMVGYDNSYISCLVAGKRRPALKLALAIEKLTKEDIHTSEWLDPLWLEVRVWGQNTK
jgi:transcriptional regulator with XRE-family HTH domain